jgi:type III pantothenate kinase
MGAEKSVRGVVVASVVPALNRSYALLAERWFGTKARFLEIGDALGIGVRYDPPSAVGADRLANALGALALVPAPLVVVDFGTATTFDAVDANRDYVGGAILPGIAISGQALVERTAKLPQIELLPPERAIGRTTVESLQSGIMLGYAGAIDSLVAKFRRELGAGAASLATGGYGEVFVEMCEGLDRYEPNLTLDGLAIAYDRLTSNRA